MKKGKRTIISKVDNGDFSFNDMNFDMDAEPENPFPGFDVPPVKYTGNQEKDAADELRYVHDSLLWVDKHPPRTGDILDSNIFLVVVFEGSKQKNAFLEALDMYQYADKYFSCHSWVQTFGIDIENGTPAKKLIPCKNEDLPTLDLNLDFNFDFGQDENKPAKPEIGETLKNIIADRKSTAEYLAWAVDPNFWFCICFATEAQKENFQKSIGLQAEKYAGFDVFWCHDFAKVFGVELEPCTFKPRVWSGKEDKKLVALIWNGETE